MWLINCGAGEDVRSLMAAGAATRVVVVDARRPIHHNFKHDGDAGIVLLHSRDDGTSLDDVPEPDGASGGESASDESDGEDRDRAGSRASDAENSPPRQRRRLDRADRARAVRAARKAYYAKGGGWGVPASLTMFELAHALRADDGHTLWLACVGAADALACDRVPRAAYDGFAARLETLAAVLPGADDEEATSIPVDAGDGGGPGATAVMRARLYGKVAPFDDVAIPLLRQWTAADALAHAPRVAAALETWTDGGRRRLDELLLRAGVGVADARAPASASAGVRAAARLADGLAAHGPAARIPPLGVRSFRLAWGGDRLAAADAAASAAALLEAGAAPGAGPGPGRDSFWRAWNALAAGQRPREGGELAAGLDLARALARAVLADGGGILSRRKLRESAAGRFRWADLSAGALAHRDLLARPLALARLAAFLRDAAAAPRGRASARGTRAVVLVGPASPDGTCPVVAAAAPPGARGARADARSGHAFGALFRRAAAAVGAHLGADGFDAAAVTLPVDAVERFMRELTVACAGAELTAAAAELAAA